MNTLVAQTDFIRLEKNIGISFSHHTVLEDVFTHRSYLNEHKDTSLVSNEKLEFLGDSVLSLITSIFLYRNYPELDEGHYTDIKASVVRTESLAVAAKEIHLDTYIKLSKGEYAQQGQENKNILADCFEALVAGIFLDKGFDVAYDFIVKFLFNTRLDHIVRNKLYLSPKSRLQEMVQLQHKTLPSYRVMSEQGPDHKKFFKVGLYINDNLIALGEGNSKKIAEENAAKKALEIP